MSKDWDGGITYETLEDSVSAEELVDYAAKSESVWVIGEPSPRDGEIAFVVPSRCLLLDRQQLEELIEALVFAARRAWGPGLFEEKDEN